MCTRCYCQPFEHAVMLQSRTGFFWHLANSDVGVLEKQLCQQVPNKVQKSFDSIKKCLWILRKQFNFLTTSKLDLKRLTSLKQMLKMLEQMKFPVLIGVSSTQSCYDHAVVIWNGIVIDYKSMYMLVTKPRNLHYRDCPLQYRYGNNLPLSFLVM